MIRSNRRVWLLLLVAVLSVPVSARAQSSGTIAGVARDATGAVLPGVTVEAASPALIEKVRSVVTDDQGNYKIVGLASGTYTVTFTLPGFSTFKRDGVQITVGFTANVNGEMKIGSLEETVTVTGASPVVDVQNSSKQVVVGKAVQEALPFGKNIAQWGVMIPGAVIGQGAGATPTQDVGGTAVKGSYIGVHGIEPNFKMGQMIDGLTYRTQESGAWALIFNSAAAEEVQMQLTGIGPEYANGTVQQNIVPRNGGNKMSLYSTGAYGNKSLEGNNRDAETTARGYTGIGSIRTLWRWNVGVGGPIKKDKLWFYGSYLKGRTSRYQPGNYYNQTQGSIFYTPDLSRQAYQWDNERDHQMRITWQATQKHKITFHAIEGGSCQCPIYSIPSAPEAASYVDSNSTPILHATWTYPVTNRLLFSARGMYNRFLGKHDRPDGVTPDTISVLDSSRNYLYNAASALGGVQTFGKGRQSYTVVQQFATNYITGSHAFKAGYQLTHGWRIDASEVNKSIRYTLRGSIPESVTYFASPLGDTEKAWDFGLYAADQWTIGRWTLNLGGRYDQYIGIIPAQHIEAGLYVPERNFPSSGTVVNLKEVTPRLGAAYDVFGNGKTALKTSLGRYLDFAVVNILVTPLNPVLTLVTSATRSWADTNGDFIPQESELGPLSNSNFGKTVPGTVYAKDVNFGWGKRNYNWQYSAQIEHELMPNLAINAGYFRTWFGNFLVTDNLAVMPGDFDPYCITTPVDTRLPGGGGQQVCGLYDIKPAKFGLVDNLVTQASNYGKRTQVYNGVDLAFTARFGKSGGQVGGGLGTGGTTVDNCTALPDSPQAQFCHNAQPWNATTQYKLNAIVPLPWDMRMSTVYQNLPGIPKTATYVATNAQIAPSLGRNLGQCRGAATCNGTTLVELIEPNTLFEKRLNQIDVRLTRIFRLAGTTRFQGNIDFDNILNANTILRTNLRYGPQWLQPSDILGARIVRLSFQFDY